MKTKTKSFKEFAESKGYKFYGDQSVVIPEKMKGEFELFSISKFISDNDLEKEYISRGLIPADPYSVLEIHKNTEEFIATHWKDAQGNWCFAAFYPWGGAERDVRVDRGAGDWLDGWWFAGVRKSDLKSSESQNQSLDTLTLETLIKEIKEFRTKIDSILKL